MMLTELPYTAVVFQGVNFSGVSPNSVLCLFLHGFLYRPQGGEGRISNLKMIYVPS